MLTSQAPNDNPDGTASYQTPAPGRFRCLECQQTFSRVEHLTRHTRGHRKEHFLKCSFCRKSFYRSDALRRHELVHKEPSRSALGKGARACLACAAARRKCTGGTPCTACERRSSQCIYPDLSQSTRPSTDVRNSGSTSGTITAQHGAANSNRDQTVLPPRAWTSNTTSPITSQSFDRALSTERRGSIGRPRETEYPSFSPNVLFTDVPSTRTHNMTPMVISDTLPEPEFWSQSSINWLPERWLPEYQVDDSAQMQLDSPNSPEANMEPQNQSMNLLAYLAAMVSKRNTPNANQSQGSPSFEIRHDLSSPGSHETQETGHFYVDGDGARLPRVRRAPHRPARSSISLSAHKIVPSHNSFGFPHSEYQSPGSTISRQSYQRIPEAIYESILDTFNQICVNSSHFLTFSSTAFPSAQLLGQFVSLYIEHFQPILPFTHPATINVANTHWLFILAMAAIGSHYADIDDVEIYSVTMHEFLRRAIATVEERKGLSTDKLLLIQAKVLNSVGMLYCGDERLLTLGKAYHIDLAAFCESEWKDSLPVNSYSPSSNIIQVTETWRNWCQAESCRRTGYTIFLLDTMWSFHFQMRPLLCLDDTTVALPCQEVLWEADSALDWQQLYSCSILSPSLQQAIEIAYVEKRLQSSMGEFSRILCIHALFRQTWQVEKYFQQPLSLWNPTAERQEFKYIQASIPVWLPGVPIYSKWRNSACDCLDILHWHANSVIGAASGMEHTTVLHLHLARVILLTPFRQIVELAQLLTQGDSTPETNPEISTLRNLIRRWATEDQHKARLAMIHAGVLFWHVRRYSTDAFYEPCSVFLATLALWAYGTFAEYTNPLSKPKLVPPTPTTTTTMAVPDDDEEDFESLFPNFIQLDRPADDELVQLFVKKGGGMKAMITGVGNLCGAKGPARVLGEGKNLLVGLGRWGWGRVGVEVLEKLREREQKERRAGEVS